MAVRTDVAGLKNRRKVGVRSATVSQGTTQSRKKTLRGKGAEYRAEGSRPARPGRRPTKAAVGKSPRGGRRAQGRGRNQTS